MEPKHVSGAYGIVWWKGEPGEMQTAKQLLDFLSELRYPDTARVFQGTLNGEAVTYVAYKYAK